MDIQWPLVFFTLLIGLGTGTFAFVAVSEWWGKAQRARVPAVITTLVALAAGGVASVLHLGHPERIFNALGHPSSGIFIEMLLVGLTGLAAIAYLIAMRAGSSAAVRKLIATVGAVLAAILSFAVGHSYVLASRPAWDTLLLPIMYVASAATLGCFCFYFWAAIRKEDAPTLNRLNLVALIAVAVQGVLLLAFLVHLGASPHQAPSRSVARLLSGDLAPVFWLGLVLLGLVLPALLTMRFWAKNIKVLTPLVVALIGLLCVILGGIAFRAPMYLIGTSIEQFM